MIGVLGIAETVAHALELAAILLICTGIGYATAAAVWGLRNGGGLELYKHYRQSLARAILLGLEILVAADIIGTVAVDPTWSNVGVLAVIVLIRTVLSWSLEVEIEGTWPWRRNADAHAAVARMNGTHA